MRTNEYSRLGQQGVYTLCDFDPPGVPLMLDSPHSGSVYPSGFAKSVNPLFLKEAEDRKIDLLFEDSACALGLPFLKAEFPRIFIDPNRAPGDIDPSHVKGSLPFRVEPGHRGRAGIGIIRWWIRPGEPLYTSRVEAAEICARLETYYHPYYAVLLNRLERLRQDYGVVWHINLHAMPPETCSHDIVLGDRDGVSCAPQFTRMAHAFFEAEGMDVAVNTPFKGVEILRRAGNPQAGFHSLQVEVNKRLYLDRGTQEPHEGLAPMQDLMHRFLQTAAEWVQAGLLTQAAD